jgi:D-xylose transport system ATP-binding protein
MVVAASVPLLELRGVSKRFGAVQALTDIQFDVRPNEVVALVGDNGAGKSTLVECLAGIYPIDSGQVFYEGEAVSIHGPKERPTWASRSSTRTSRSPTTSTWCRTCSSAARSCPGRCGRSTKLTMEKRAKDTLATLSVTTMQSVRQTVAGLSGGQRQSVAVAKAVMWNSKVVILDEPTAALGVAQTRQVLDLVKRLGQQGLAVVLISHNLHDIFEVADSITVLRLGQNVAVFKRADVTRRRSSRPSPRAHCPRCQACTQR